MSEAAWYDVKMNGWLRNFLILLHPPYTLWHLSYVPIGAALAPVMNWPILGWTVLAFFLGMGIGGHCLDELNGRPLKTKVPRWLLGCVAGASIAGAVAIGVLIGLRETIWVLPCIVFGGFIVFAYNMEWPSSSWRPFLGVSFGPPGFFHRDIWFGIAWGAFPAITAYVAQTHTLNIDIILLTFACWGYSMAQRALSTQSRFWRRKVFLMAGHYVLNGDPVASSPRKLVKKDIFRPADLALKFMTWSVVAAAIGLLLTHI